MHYRRERPAGSRCDCATDQRRQLCRAGNGHEPGRARDAFSRGWFAGEHAVFIHSDRCLGFTHLGDCPRVILDTKKSVVRDFRLKIACQLRVQTVDEEGRPIAGVRLFKVEPNNPYQADTDRQGWMTIGGLVPAEYLLSLANKDFVPTILIVKIERLGRSSSETRVAAGCGDSRHFVLLGRQTRRGRAGCRHSQLMATEFVSLRGNGQGRRNLRASARWSGPVRRDADNSRSIRNVAATGQRRSGKWHQTAFSRHERCVASANGQH